MNRWVERAVYLGVGLVVTFGMGLSVLDGIAVGFGIGFVGAIVGDVWHRLVGGEET